MRARELVYRPVTMRNLFRPRVPMLLLLLLALALPVFAQGDTAVVQPTNVITAANPPDAGVLADVSGPDFTADLAALSADPGNVEVYVRLAMHAVVNGQWALLVSLILTLIIAGLRKWVPETWALGKWLRTKLGGMLSSLGLSLGLGFVTALISGQPFSLAVVIKAVTIAITASGSWAIYKNFKEAVDEKKATEAGAAAADAPSGTLDK